ncbi:MAG: toprim domain-containing protein [Candidatus Melainabacteria bacterium]|nr:toprim domain-containing protein [Candidatus Melainabacteria bacterium]
MIARERGAKYQQRDKDVCRGRFQEILPAAGVPSECLQNKHGPCPMCGGNDRFRFDDKNGTGSWYCNQCGSGDGFELIKRFRNLNFPDAIRLALSVLGGTAARSLPPIAVQEKPGPTSDEIEHARLRLENYFGGCLDAKNSPADNYYASRYLPCESTELRYCPERHAVVARLVNPKGTLTALHQTLLNANGEKVGERLTKKLFDGANRGGAIRLHNVTDEMVIGEGIETSLAASILAGGTPCWAAWCANNLEVVELPPGVRKVTIAADHDLTAKGERGQTAANKLAERLLGEGRDVSIALPPVPGTDWADVLKSLREAS